MATGPRQQKAGLPPGTPIYTGQTSAAEVQVLAIDYDAEHFAEQRLTQVADCVPFRDSAQPTWIRVDGIHRVELVEQLGAVFDLHPLVVEDIVNVAQRPKLDDYGEYLFAVFKMARLDDQGRAQFEQVSVILGRRFVLSFQESGETAFADLQSGLEGGRALIRSKGPDYLAYRLLDIAVDHAFAALEALGERVEEIEDRLVRTPEPDLLHEIHELKRDLMAMRRSLWPLREVVALLDRTDSPLIGADTRVYLKDLYDHTIQAIEMTETELELISGMHDLYLNGLSNRLNEVMKVLAVISTTFLPMNFIAGMYGMNFQQMPGLATPGAFWIAVLVMLSIAGASLAFYRRRGWI